MWFRQKVIAQVNLSLKAALFALLLLLGYAETSAAAALVFQWNPTTDSQIKGYRITYGFSVRRMRRPIFIGLRHQYQLNRLRAGQIVYFSVQAQSVTGVLSPPSQRLKVRVARIRRPRRRVPRRARSLAALSRVPTISAFGERQSPRSITQTGVGTYGEQVVAYRLLLRDLFPGGVVRRMKNELGIQNTSEQFGSGALLFYDRFGRVIRSQQIQLNPGQQKHFSVDESWGSDSGLVKWTPFREDQTFLFENVRILDGDTVVMPGRIASFSTQTLHLHGGAGSRYELELSNPLFIESSVELQFLGELGQVQAVHNLSLAAGATSLIAFGESQSKFDGGQIAVKTQYPGGGIAFGLRIEAEKSGEKLAVHGIPG